MIRGLKGIQKLDFHFTEHKEKLDIFSKNIIQMTTILDGVSVYLRSVRGYILIRVLDKEGSGHHNPVSSQCTQEG